jgi:hypothetical protein
MSDAHATQNHARESFEPWLEGTVVKLCGKIVPLRKVVSTPVVEENNSWLWGDKVTYRLTVTEENYLRECPAH